MEHHTTEYNMFTHLLSGPKIACQVSLHSTKTTSQVQTFLANYASCAANTIEEHYKKTRTHDNGLNDHHQPTLLQLSASCVIDGTETLVEGIIERISLWFD
jgi:hypothetical protein